MKNPLEQNLRDKFESLNRVSFTDFEFERFQKEIIDSVKGL